MKLAIPMLALIGCGSLTLRPVQRDHALRLAEVREKLATDQAHVDAALALDQGACDAIDGKVTGWTATSVVVGALSGGSGLTSIFTDAPARYATAGIAIGLSTIGALSAFMSTHYSQAYARKCAINTGGQ